MSEKSPSASKHRSRCPAWRSISSTCPASAAFNPRSSSRWACSSRAIVSSSYIARFAISARLGQLVGLAPPTPSRERPPNAATSQLTTDSPRRGDRVRSRARSSSWRCSAALDVRRRSASRRSSMCLNAALKALHLLGSEPPNDRCRRRFASRAAPGQRFSIVVHRDAPEARTAPMEHAQVDERS